MSSFSRRSMSRRGTKSISSCDKRQDYFLLERKANPTSRIQTLKLDTAQTLKQAQFQNRDLELGWEAFLEILGLLWHPSMSLRYNTWGNSFQPFCSSRSESHIQYRACFEAAPISELLRELCIAHRKLQGSAPFVVDTRDGHELS